MQLPQIILLLTNNAAIVLAAGLHLEYEWTYINFTWPSRLHYQYALQTKSYIPENNIPTAIKIHDKKLYMALGRTLPGTPVTLAYLSATPDEYNKKNPVVIPFPSWDMNVGCNCSTLQNVYGIEIDPKGVMWIVDGIRNNNLTDCPPKIVLFDIKKSEIIQQDDFPAALSNDAFLSDLVVDENFAYICDNSMVDPGLVIYSRLKNKFWKIRDPSMYPQVGATDFQFGKTKTTVYSGITNLALSPLESTIRYVYYTDLSSLLLYAINTEVLRDEELCKTNSWRIDVKNAARKVDKSSVLAMDNQGNLYFNLVNQHAMAKWNVYKKFSTSALVLFKDGNLNWCSSFAFDNNGNLFVLVNNYGNVLANITKTGTNFRVYSMHTNTKSYFYNKTKNG